MRELLAGFYRQSFNDPATDKKISQRTEEMLQAFYRREPKTIDMLAKKGARFTPEMLEVSIKFRDPHLAERCMNAGVLPTEDMLRGAVDKRDAPMVNMILSKLPLTAEMQSYIARSATDAVKHAASPYARPVAEMHDLLRV